MPSTSLRRRIGVSLLVLAMLAPEFGAADVLGTVRGVIPGLGFSVSGKPGPYMAQISKRKIEPMKPGGEGALGFGGEDRGEYQSARINMPQTEKKLEEMIASLDTHWPYAHPPAVKVHLLAVGKYGPYALPDGSIAVPVGFLIRAESDDEVAFVLGHEYAHLALAHFGRNDRMRSQRKIVTALAKIYSACVALSEIRAEKVGDDTHLVIADKKRVAAARDRAVSDKKSLDWVLNNLVEPAWKRRQEDEADALGFDMARGLNYAAADAAGPAFQKITVDDSTRLDLVNGLQKRIKEAFDEAMAKNSQEAGKAGDVSGLMDTFTHSLTGGLKTLALHGIEGFLSAKHRPPQDRQKGIGDYSNAAYPGAASLADLKMTWLTQVRSTKEFITAKTAVNALQIAQTALDAKDIPGAEKAIKIALATPYGGIPLITTAAGRIYRAKGDFKNAEIQFTRADSHPEQSLDGYRDHVSMTMDRKDYARALQVIALYKTRSKTEKDFLPELIRIHLKLKKNDQAIAYLNQCLAYEEPALTDSCSLMAYGPDDAEWAALPDGAKEKLSAAIAKASSQQSIAGGLTDLFKSWDKTEDKDKDA